jgi:RNA 3'-terminal phosphate cyclase
MNFLAVIVVGLALTIAKSEAETLGEQVQREANTRAASNGLSSETAVNAAFDAAETKAEAAAPEKKQGIIDENKDAAFLAAALTDNAVDAALYATRVAVAAANEGGATPEDVKNILAKSLLTTAPTAAAVDAYTAAAIAVVSVTLEEGNATVGIANKAVEEANKATKEYACYWLSEDCGPAF